MGKYLAIIISYCCSSFLMSWIISSEPQKNIKLILICRTRTKKKRRACSTYINFRFLSASNAETIESNTFCTQAPCVEKGGVGGQISKKKKKNNNNHPFHDHFKRRVGKEINLDGIVRANIILINRLQPSNIIVRMRDQVNIKLPGINSLGGIIHHELRFSAKKHW